jgi:kynurenine formamidase
MTTNIIDFTREIYHNMPVYPGDKPIQLTQTSDLKKDGYNSYTLWMELHSGTHLDGLSHICEDTEEKVSDIPLEKLMGRGFIINAYGQETIDYKPEYENKIKSGSIVLIRTGFDEYWGSEKYFFDYPLISENMAKFLVHKKIIALGLDTPSPDKHPYDIHKMFFNNGIFIAENLVNLESAINIKNLQVFIVPLKIFSDSAPARVFGFSGKI